MGGAFSRFTALLAIGLFVFIIPFYYLAQNQCGSENGYLFRSTTEFINRVKKEDGITREAYEILLSELAITGGNYDVVFSHAVPVRSIGSKDKNRMSTKLFSAIQLNSSTSETPEPIGIRLSPEKLSIKLGEELSFQVFLILSDGSLEEVDGWSSDYDSEKAGLQIVTVTYLEFTAMLVVEVLQEVICNLCNRPYLIDPLISGSECPFCMLEVSEIALYLTKTELMPGETPEITVIIFYRDGRAEAVDDWESSFQRNLTGWQTVTINCRGMMAEVLVYVRQRMVTCTKCGYEYDADLVNYCTECSKTLEKVEFRLLTPLIEKGEQPKFSMLLYFADGHNESLMEGYLITGFQSEMVGGQKFLVEYGGFQEEFTVRVTERVQYYTCSGGHLYYAELDGSDQGCPVCMQQDSSKESILYFEQFTNQEIMDQLYLKGHYSISKGDCITVTILQHAPSYSEQLKTAYRLGGTAISTYLEKSVKAVFGGTI